MYMYGNISIPLASQLSLVEQLLDLSVQYWQPLAYSILYMYMHNIGRYMFTVHAQVTTISYNI